MVIEFEMGVGGKGGLRFHKMTNNYRGVHTIIFEHAQLHQNMMTEGRDDKRSC